MGQREEGGKKMVVSFKCVFIDQMKQQAIQVFWAAIISFHKTQENAVCWGRKRENHGRITARGSYTKIRGSLKHPWSSQLSSNNTTQYQLCSPSLLDPGCVSVCLGREGRKKGKMVSVPKSYSPTYRTREKETVWKKTKHLKPLIFLV